MTVASGLDPQGSAWKTGPSCGSTGTPRAGFSDSGITTPADEYFECTRKTQTIQNTQGLAIWHGRGTNK